jgi:hypothetical protein
MSRDLNNEIQRLTMDMEVVFQKTRPTEIFRATMILASVHLGIIAERSDKSQDSEERRRFIDEYDRQKESIRKGIQMLYQSARRRETAPAPCRALP